MAGRRYFKGGKKKEKEKVMEFTWPKSKGLKTKRTERELVRGKWQDCKSIRRRRWIKKYV